MGGGVSGYSAVPRFEAPEPPVSRINTSSPASPSAPRTPAFKGSGMKLGAKKSRQAELMDALGGEAAVASPEMSAPATPTASTNAEQASQKIAGRGSLPEVTPERHVMTLTQDLMH
jgi:hypothetical protein